MTEEQVEVEVSRVNQEWPTSLKEAVQSKVGRRGLTEFTIMAVSRHLDDGSADLAVESREARELAQRLANVLATVVDHEARLTFLSSIILPDWIDTRSWPDEVLSRLPVEIDNATDAEAEPEIDDVPEMKKVDSVTTTRLEPKVEVGTAEEPVIYPEGKINAMDGPTYAALQHVHAPDGRCLKNLFIEKGEDGKKHCPIVNETPEVAPLPHDAGAGGDNLFDRLKQSGHLKPASTLPTPSQSPEDIRTAADVAQQDQPAEHTLTHHEMDQMILNGVPERTAGPDSGPLPPVLEENYAPDATPIPEVQVTALPTTCPSCKTPLDDGLCWTCGFAA